MIEYIGIIDTININRQYELVCQTTHLPTDSFKFKRI